MAGKPVSGGAQGHQGLGGEAPVGVKKNTGRLISGVSVGLSAIRISS